MSSCKKVRSGSVQPGGLHVMYSRVVYVSGGLLDLLTRSCQKPRFLPAETKLVSDKRAGARLVDGRSTRRAPARTERRKKRRRRLFLMNEGGVVWQYC